MKKLIVAFSMLLTLCVTNAFAGYIVNGVQKRVDAVTDYMVTKGHTIAKQYGQEVMGSLNGKPWTGVQVVRVGAPANEGIWIPVSDVALRGGLCADQKAQIDRIPLNITPAETIPPCATSNDGCYGPGGMNGYYQTLQPYEGIRTVVNTGNDRYPANSITFKIEYQNANLTDWTYGTGWGPTIVIRNPTVENPVGLIDLHRCRILPYLVGATNLKVGQSGNEGQSCWEVVVLHDGTIYKNESPAAMPY